MSRLNKAITAYQTKLKVNECINQSFYLEIRINKLDNRL